MEETSISNISNQIRSIYRDGQLLPWEKGMFQEDLITNPFLKTEAFLRGYMQVKYAISKVLQPSNIVEIGIGAGNSAIAFALGNLQTIYLGIDNNSKGIEQNIDYTKWLGEQLLKLGIEHNFLIKDSRLVSSHELSNRKIELFHVDGDHTYSVVRSDCELAFSLRPKYILVDDSKDPQVAKGAIEVLAKTEAYEWCYFEDTLTGNILFRNTAW